MRTKKTWPEKLGLGCMHFSEDMLEYRSIWDCGKRSQALLGSSGRTDGLPDLLLHADWADF